jgi:chemotaxis protein methyltransferase CheR
MAPAPTVWAPMSRAPDHQEAEARRSLLRLVEGRFGIHSTLAKPAAVERRLSRLFTELGVSDALSVLERYPLDSPELIGLLADHFTTNYTYFYREPHVLDWFRAHALPEALDHARARSPDHPDLRVWCAAASTGQEPYTLGMILREALKGHYASWTAGVLATDVSREALLVAQRGEYAAEALAKLPAGWAQRWFAPVPGYGAGRVLRANPDLRADTLFGVVNLVAPSYPFRGRFDVIFVRNVLIYFDAPVTASVLGRLASLLHPGGFLVVGASERVPPSVSALTGVGPSIYQRREPQ